MCQEEEAELRASSQFLPKWQKCEIYAQRKNPGNILNSVFSDSYTNNNDIIKMDLFTTN